ncbi:hypothetical protein BCR44DRAFT_48323 [Catenaria anguillulae PL171]|uniref:BTB domain-containing protein n=1 Tax=Catenaria anguillulae PL171 TaxID=765915 RepID=A0A1Y2HED2_9FUNG|nr:hypothetical protein BCR44DRAFT_48323 [Catenaria anguillulae PL171]
MRRLDIPPSALFKCSIYITVNITDGRLGNTNQPDLGIHSCILGNLRNGATFAIPVSSISFGAREKVRVNKVNIKLEPLQIDLPAKYSVLAPSSLTSFNDPDLSDCSLLPKDSSTAIHVSRAILARASPYFVTMFKGTWAPLLKLDAPIAFGWPASALLLELMDLAQLLELRVLRGAVGREMVKVLSRQIEAVDVEVKKESRLVAASAYDV